MEKLTELPHGLYLAALASGTRSADYLRMNVQTLLAALAPLPLAAMACAPGTADGTTIYLTQTHSVQGSLVTVDIEVDEDLPADLLDRVLDEYFIRQGQVPIKENDRTIYDPFVRLKVRPLEYHVVLPAEVTRDLSALAAAREREEQPELTKKNL